MQKETIDKIRAFNRFYTGIIGVIDDHILDSPYSLSEVRVMFEIYHNSNITARQIRDILQVDEGYLSRLIAKQERQAIIQKKRSSIDKRITFLTLTKKGEKIFLKLNEKSSKSISVVFSHLNKKEQKELTEHFERIKILLTQKKIK
ncbi:MarR family winged helix-turn-helix transcriptional regulator [Compostibacter hankyongensis]|uniref:HTH-type transcriptional regulator SarZ n=1 Tax=Compostibacter hankyongensis TaxID=1007089 RepID=A0ABP8FWP0_9BACT